MTFSILLLAACAPREPLPQVAEELRKFDVEVATIEARLGEIQQQLSREPPDFRGRTPAQDFDEWVLAKRARDEIRALRTEAAESNGAPAAKEELGRAVLVLKRETERATDVGEYWTAHRPAPHWRLYWNALHEANGVEPEAPDSMLLSIEKGLSESLAKGDFGTAARDSDVLTSVLTESLDRASMRIVKARNADSTFAPRKTACVPGAAPDRTGRRVRLQGGEAIERFYPAEAMKRGETGSVILRARVDAKGCGTDVAIVVHSGVESLDAAALQWFETAQFSPKWQDGRATAADLTFKVKFILKE